MTIVSLIDNACRKVAVAVNSELSVLYWHIGKQINESVLNNEKADYGKTVVKELSAELTRILWFRFYFDRFNLQSANLRCQMRRFQKPVIPCLTRDPLQNKLRFSGDCGSSLRYARNDDDFSLKTITHHKKNKT
ncbi:MAG: DUF1016 N-terminal domain-containing protein [Dysgonamonadaceae bacterium]|nr:DUF1016 N-terminal domain-containing protein [Dysgonamonadaceae bacterium]